MESPGSLPSDRVDWRCDVAVAPRTCTGGGVARRPLVAAAVGAVASALVPTLARAAAKPLVVGGLAVTCNLTLPVACVAKAKANAADKSGKPPLEFEYS